MVAPRLAGGARRGLRVPPATPSSGQFRSVPHRLRRRAETGTVTAETAVVLPVLVMVVLGLVWAVCLGVAQVRVVDAARETARAVARDEAADEAISLGRRVAPPGSHIEVRDQGGTVDVLVSAEVDGPGGLLSFLPAVNVDASAVAAKEPS